MLRPAFPNVPASSRNASPNVVDLLLDNRSAEKNADMRKERRGKGRTPNPKTPVKMAPVVCSETL